MIKKLTISGFRGFQSFEVHDLGRINLIVGTNNCGKSSILEAVQIFASKGDPSSLWQITSRRGERLSESIDTRNLSSPELDIRHLFYGHTIEIGSEFRIVAQLDSGTESITATVLEGSKQRGLFEDQSLSGTGDEIEESPDLAIEFQWSAAPEAVRPLPLTLRGGIPGDIVRRFGRLKQDLPDQVKFISTAGLSVDDVVTMFEEIVLTNEEDLVIQALRTIDPSIERLATLSGERRRTRSGERGGIVVKCRDSTQRYPIGSMGDGMWRMLGLALAIVSARNGILLVDEIDTGLHFTILERMWKLIDGASKRLSVQVFATSHSRDAYESLAAIAHSKVSKGSQVTIQRIEPLKGKSIPFTEQEIVASAEIGTEVR